MLRVESGKRKKETLTGHHFISARQEAEICVHPPCSRPSRQVRVHPWLKMQILKF